MRERGFNPQTAGNIATPVQFPRFPSSTLRFAAAAAAAAESSRVSTSLGRAGGRAGGRLHLHPSSEKGRNEKKKKKKNQPPLRAFIYLSAKGSM